MNRLTNTIYQGYINISKESDNRFDICEPIFSPEDIEMLEIRYHHNQRHYGFKHNYKFRNKVIIDGQIIRHQKHRIEFKFEYIFITTRYIGGEKR